MIYIVIEVSTLSKAFTLLYASASPISLETYRPIALATIGIGFTLLFMQLSYRVFLSSGKRRVIAVSALLIPFFFAGGQLIGMWVSNNATHLLSNTAKQQAVNAAFYRMSGKHDNFFPFALSADSRHYQPSVSEANAYIMSIPDRTYSAIIDASSDSLRSLYLNYKHNQPSETEWYIAKRGMQQRLDGYSMPLADSIIRKRLLLRPPSLLAPMFSEWQDGFILSMMPDISLDSHRVAREQLRMQRYGFLIGHESDSQLAVDAFNMNMQHAVRDVLKIDRTVDENFYKVAKGDPLEHLLWTEKLPELIPDKGYVSSIPFGLSAYNFFHHTNTVEIIKTHMPYFFYNNTPLISLERFSDSKHLHNLNSQLFPLSQGLKKASSGLWSLALIDKMEDNTAFEISWYESISRPLVTMSFSVPIVVIFSTTLLLVNLYHLMMVMGATKKLARMTVMGILVALTIAPKGMVTKAIDNNFDKYFPALSETLHAIGIEQTLL